MGELGMLLIYLLVGCLIVYIAYWALTQMNLPNPWRTVIIVIIAIIAIMFLLRLVGML